MSHDNSESPEFSPTTEDSDQVDQWQSNSTDESSQSKPVNTNGMDRDGKFNAPSDPGIRQDNALEGEIYDEVQRRVEHGVEQTLVQMISHSGPLPPASEFAAYESVLSGAADRILAMVEKSIAEATQADAAATRAAASSILDDGVAVKRGQYIYAGITLMCFVSAVILVIFEHPIPAAISGATGIGSGFGVLITPVNKDRWRPHNSSPNPEIL